ncbi:MBL fold metallo-hydrolase [Vreelandella lionensis]|uniref:MBL fold metallo-hydrolase n=1 Tax=Vreelandella lionensis TaxID=1144478 RepID=UPI001A9EB6A1|nr:MBL fold metallo-hydrolase [Halomonas lionensis]
MQTAVNAFLIHTGQNLVLVDAGSAACFGPTLGQVEQNLRASGYAPEQVDTILMTHLHPDHVCGLVDENGEAVYPNAELRASEGDADFWLDEERSQALPRRSVPSLPWHKRPWRPIKRLADSAPLRRAMSC